MRECRRTLAVWLAEGHPDLSSLQDDMGLLFLQASMCLSELEAMLAGSRDLQGQHLEEAVGEWKRWGTCTKRRMR